MKVYANGFQLSCTGPLTVEGIFTELSRDAIHEFKHSLRERVLAVERSGGFFAGCLLSMRDADTYLTLEKGDDGVLFAKHRQMDGGPHVDFLFFVLSAKTSNGIFTQYQGSGGLTQFGNLLHNRYQGVLSAAKEVEVEELGDSDEVVTDDARKELDKRYRGTLHARPLSTNPNFARELKRLKDLSRFEYLTPIVKEPYFRSIKKQVEYVRSSVVFSKERSKFRDLCAAISKLVVGDGITEGTAHGHNSSGDMDHVTIHPEHFCMASYPYRQVARGEIRLSGFAAQDLVGKLLSIAGTHKALF